MTREAPKWLMNVVRMDEPVDCAKLKQLVRRILEDGRLEISGHARAELINDELDDVDVANVLRGGWFEPGEWENGDWRYKARTPRMCVVFSLRSEDELVVVTAWRQEK